MAMTLEQLQILCHQASLDGGWWDEEYSTLLIATKLCLIHSEISEAMEGLRKDNLDSHLPHYSAFRVELADAIIRILDLAGFFSFDLESVILEKLEYNRTRQDHKLENRAASGGKKF